MTTWIMLRAVGIASYLLLFGSVVWGLAGTTSVFGKRIAKATSVAIHQFMSTVALVLLLGHIVGLLIDEFVPFAPLQVVLPMTSSYRPIAVSLGVIAMYLVVVVAGTSWLRKWIRTSVWRALHLLAVPAFALALVHGLLAGSDSTSPWLFWVYVATGGIVFFLVVLRGFTVGLRRERAAAPARAGPPRAKTSGEYATQEA